MTKPRLSMKSIATAWLAGGLAFVSASCGMIDGEQSRTYADAYEGPLHFSLRHPVANEPGSFNLLFSAPETADKLIVCEIADPNACRSGEPTFQTPAKLATRRGQTFFYAERATKLKVGGPLSIIAFNARGDLIEQRALRFRETAPTGDTSNFEKFTGQTLRFNTLTIASPVSWQVFQRTSEAEGPLRVRFTLPSRDVRKVRVRVGEGATDGRWQSFEAPAAEVFDQVVPSKAGGWYQVEILLHDAQDKLLGRGLVEKVGVGEVFVVAGQSNSTNCGATPSNPAPRTGKVASTDGVRWQEGRDPQIGTNDFSQCQGGSSWPTAGDLLVEQFKVPVAFASTGYSGSAVRQWLPEASELARPSGGDAGEHASVPRGLFDFALARMKQLGKGGFRAVLWHQGEDDARLGTSEDLYYRRMAAMIGAFREGVDNWREMPWLVAQASWCVIDTFGYRGDSPAILAAQARLWNDPRIFAGPNTDGLRDGFRIDPRANCHFSEAGQKESGKLWAEKIGRFLGDELKNR